MQMWPYTNVGTQELLTKESSINDQKSYLKKWLSPALKLNGKHAQGFSNNKVGVKVLHRNTKAHLKSSLIQRR